MKPYKLNVPPRSRGAGISRDKMYDEAATWLARRQAGFAVDEERQFQAWLAVDPRHAAAFADSEAVWTVVRFPSKVGQADVANARLNGLQRRRVRRRRAFALAGVNVAAAVALLLTFVPAGSLPIVPTPPPSVANVSPNRQDLPDGSAVELNSGAEIAVEFSERRRGVRLICGEAFFAVAKDAARPFVVIVGGVEVRAIGTIFSIRSDPDRIDVLVTEGGVAVARAADGRNLLRPAAGTVQDASVLSAGHRVSIALDALAAAGSIAIPVDEPAIERALAWRNRRIEFTRATLADAIQLFNRQNRLQLAAGDSAAGAIRISGIFWADDPEAFVRLIQTGFGVHSSREGDAIVLRSR